MAEKALIQIKEAEAQAQVLLENAREEAAQIVARAEDKNAESFARLSEACGQQASESKQQAQANARAASAAFAEETMRQCAALKQQLLSRKAQAIAAVTQTIMQAAGGY